MPLGKFSALSECNLFREGMGAWTPQEEQIIMLSNIAQRLFVSKMGPLRAFESKVV